MRLIRNSRLFLLLISIDQLSKWLVLKYCIFGVTYKIFSIVSCKLVFNRGIAFGLFNCSEKHAFIGVSLAIIVVYQLFVGYFFIGNCRRSFESLKIGELLILAGGLSNIIDRLMHAGVVDFILLSYHGWAWPIFNIADACIVLGVFIMGWSLLK
ncbi:MAG: signal peptidase II [Candidatus Babeliales bacterium]